MRRLSLGICGTTILAGAIAFTPAVASAADHSVSYLAPEYQVGELTGDQKIDTDDIALLMSVIGVTEDDGDAWDDVSAADNDGDGVITVFDIATVSQRFLYDDGDFDVLEASVVDIQSAMTAGSLTSQQLTATYLQRISAYDRAVGIDTRTEEAAADSLESIIRTNPQAMSDAAALDAERLTSGPRSMLHGVPVIVKDNINTIGMPTTAGCRCLEDNVTSTDAETIERLKAAGAVVIAKANLSEFAQATTTSISKYATTRNAYRLDRASGGSSGGTAASIAANFASIGLGTDTGGSVRVPSSFNALVGIRPTIGLVSREGVIPLDLYRDTVGPMTRSVSDAALALDALAGSDPSDAVTAEADRHKPASYASYLDPVALDGKRIGYIPGLLSGNDRAPGARLMATALSDLTAAGAEIVEVGSFGTVNGFGIGGLPGSSSFTHDMDEYLDTYYRDGATFLDLADAVAESERTNPDDDLSSWPASTIRGWASITPEQRAAAFPRFAATQEAMRDRIDDLMEQHDLDALVYPSTGGVVGSPASNNRISAYSGYPAVSVPMGYADGAIDDTSHNGTPMGLELLGAPYSEGELIGYAYAYEQETLHRQQSPIFPALPTRAP